MVWLKECPRCQGDLFLDQDHFGKFKTCIQCGYMRDLVEGVVVENPRPAVAIASNGQSAATLIAG